MRILPILLAPSAPPPSPATQVHIPIAVWVAVPVLVMTGLFVLGATMYMMGGALILLALLGTTWFFYPALFSGAVHAVLVLVVLPTVIMGTGLFHWSIPLFLMPLYILLVFSQSSLLGTALLAIGMLLFGAVYFNFSGFFTPESPLGVAMEAQTQAAFDFINTLREVPGTVYRVGQTEVLRATGQYYEGKVDQNAKKILGVQVGDPQISDTIEGVSTRVFAQITAEPLDEAIIVVFACSIDGKEPDRYIPSSASVTFSSSGAEEVVCAYDKGSLTAGTKVFSLNATYGFRTLGYLVGSFANSDRLQQLRRQGTDLSKDPYYINEDPSAIYTNGPIKIGMNLGGVGASQPISMYSDLANREFVIGATIDHASSWATGGVLSSMGNFFFMVPAQVNINEVNLASTPVVFTKSSCSALPVDEQQGCDDEKFNVYEVDMMVAREEIGSVFALPITIRALSTVDRQNYVDFLGAGGISQHLFMVTFDYEFTVSKQKAFTVRPAPTSAPTPAVTS